MAPINTTLRDASIGAVADVISVDHDPLGLRLHELGLTAGQRVEVMSTHNPMICKVGTARIGISSQLASRVQVRIQ